MFKSVNHRFVKMCLIVLSEFVAMVATHLFSHYVFPIPHSFISYILCGAVLAAIVVTVYDKTVTKRKTKAQAELTELTKVAYKIYQHNK
jgi:positive regulator of sigma E activity